MKITVVDAGYQGLVVAACLAESGHNVTCVDNDPGRVELLNNSQIPFRETGLEELVVRNIEEERLSFTTKLDEAVAECLVVMFCIKSPADENGDTDIAPLLQAVRATGKAMDGYRIIVNKSPCPPGTADKIEEALVASTGHDFDVVVNPDFMKEGSAIDDFMRPDRVVIGCGDVRVREMMRELYSPYLRTGKPCLLMGRRSAEMTKYATNVMLASRLSLMNQIADLCEACGADISEVREGLGSDDRIGPTFLFPGIGFGGIGLPNDLAVCLRLAREYDVESDLIDAIGNVNRRRLEQFAQRIMDHFEGDLTDKNVAVWGATYKPRTDDLRGAPALKLIDTLREKGAQVSIYDPAAGAKLKTHYGDEVAVAKKYYEALDEADALVIMTEWNEFRRPDYERMGKLMRSKVIFDGRNLYTPATMEEHGFRYYSIGRPTV